MGITAAVLSFDRFIGNRAGEFDTPNSLDFTGNFSNQQARVDIMTMSANPFSVSGSDVLFKVFQTAVGDPFLSGYTTQTTDLTNFLIAHQGQTLRLRFALANNLFFGNFQFGVDGVILAVSTSTGGGAPREASGTGGQATALLLGTREKGEAQGLFAMPLPSEPSNISMSVPLPPARAVRGQGTTYLDRFFASTDKEDRDLLFAFNRRERGGLALVGAWQDAIVTGEILQDSGT
jgi:hypothetical protein